jgi:hypothetical protein
VNALTRHMIDRIARAVVSGRRGYGEREDGLADVVAGLMQNRLEAVGARGAKRARCGGRIEVAACDRPILNVLLVRTEKHLAWQALARSDDGCSQPH